jgi:hypothetical protein
MAEPQIPLLRETEPYYGTPAQKRGDYYSDAHRAATLVEGIYHDIIGASRDPHTGKPLLVRDIRDLEEIKERIKEVEKEIARIMKTYQLGQWGDIDNIILYAKKRLLGPVQEEYNKIKERILKGLKYEEKISKYRIDEALKAAKQRETFVKSDIQTLEGKEKLLFNY